MAHENYKLAEQLYSASCNGQEEKVLILLKRGAPPSNSGYYKTQHGGFTPLHVTSDPVIAQHLIHWGAQLEATYLTFGITPLHDACSNNKRACAEVLMRNYCSRGIRNKDGETPADVARSHGYPELAKFVENYQVTPRELLSGYPSIKQLSQLQVTDCYKLGHAFGVSKDQLDTAAAKSDLPPIAVVFLTAKQKKPELNWKDVVQGLLAVGEYATAASLCCQEELNGHTPLSVSAYYGWVELLEYLMDKEKQDPKESDCKTILSLACSKGHIGVIDYLIRVKGLDSEESLNAAGDTLRSLAESLGHTHIIKYLESIGTDSTETQEASAGTCKSTPVVPRNWTAVTDNKTNKVVYVSNNKAKGNVSTPPGYPLHQTPSHPCVTFYDEPQENEFTHSCNYFDFDNGVEVTVPPDTIKAGSSINIKVQPSLAPKDVFIMPHGIQSASPSYLISREDGNTGGEVTVTMEHHVRVITKEDAENLLFLRADSTPKKSGSTYVYEFKEVPGAESQFIPGENKGRLITTHFSFLKIGIRLKKLIGGLKPSSKGEQQASDHTLYTVRVYRSPPQTTGDRMAIICVSLFGKFYGKFLEELDNDMIPYDYPEVSTSKADRTIVGFLQFAETFATLSIQPLQGWTVEPDKEMITKAEVDQPETENYNPVDLHDYPPKIVCRFYPDKNAPERATAKLSIVGIKPGVTVSMPLRAPAGKVQVMVDTSKLQEAAINLKKTALNVNEGHLGLTVDSILSLIDEMTSTLRSSSLDDLALHTESISKEIKTVLKVSKEVAEECTRQTIKVDINDSLSKMEVLCHQLCQCTKVKLKHCQDQSEETAALVDLVESGANLLTTVDRLLSDMKTLCGFSGGSSRRVIASSGFHGGLSPKAVVKATSDARSRWYDLGIELGIDLETLKSIGKKHLNISSDCHGEMVTCWLALTSPAPSWSALVEALQCNVISRGDIAHRIQEEHHCGSKQETEEKDFTLKQVRRITWDARSEWRNLGSELSIDSDTLAAIEETYNGRVDCCHTAMIVHWFQCSLPNSSSLIEALSSQTVGPRGDIASAVEERWGTETVYISQVL